MKIKVENNKTIEVSDYTDTYNLEKEIKKLLSAPRKMDDTENFALRYILSYLLDREARWHDRAELLDLDVDDLEEFEAANDFWLDIDENYLDKDFENALSLSIPAQCERAYVAYIYYDYNKSRYIFDNDGI